MKTIYKYTLAIEAEQTLHIPGGGGHVLHVGEQNGELCVWLLVDTAKPEKPRRFSVVGTGQPSERVEEDFHVGTAQVGTFVWHVFSRTP